ncbi:MAG: DNA replication/repair protein RecF [Gammaproteobacteria bacterium]|nr:DNA replication/repair protein RecF [Gammaproteobacteria bacterium]
MLVKQLKISGFRNIEQTHIDTHKDVNVFYGANGSGKTSILESVFYLSRAKSFRTNKRLELLKTSSNYLAVNADIMQDETEKNIGIGLDENGNGLLKLDGQISNKLSDVSRLTPVQLITPESFDWFWSVPKARRNFLDFGLFHVEHEFQNLWQNFNKLQKQTNSLLRQVKWNADPKNVNRELIYWYKSLIEAAQKVDGFREMFLEKHLSKAITELESLLSEDDKSHLVTGMKLKYKKKSVTLESDEQLEKLIEKDKKYKQVSFGPNRADLQFIKEGEDISAKLSRGQSKMLFYLLEVAMVKIIKATTGKNLLMLVDDLPSEVDVTSRDTMLRMLIHSKAQIFVTGIENKIAMEFMKYTDSVNVFHVEHGAVRRENMEQLCP